MAGPTTASLLGDVWPAADRGRIYGLITSGELIGAGVGFVLFGELAAVPWRLAFPALALPAAILAARISRLPEPKRTVRRVPRQRRTRFGHTRIRHTRARRVPRPRQRPRNRVGRSLTRQSW